MVLALFLNRGLIDRTPNFIQFSALVTFKPAYKLYRLETWTLEEGDPPGLVEEGESYFPFPWAQLWSPTHPWCDSTFLHAVSTLVSGPPACYPDSCPGSCSISPPFPPSLPGAGYLHPAVDPVPSTFTFSFKQHFGKYIFLWAIYMCVCLFFITFSSFCFPSIF